MILMPGGEAPIMPDSWYIDQLAILSFNLPIFQLIPNNLRVKPKGLKRLLEERGLWRPGLRLKCKTLDTCDSTNPIGCCAHTLMSLQPDFKQQKCRLAEVVL